MVFNSSCVYKEGRFEYKPSSYSLSHSLALLRGALYFAHASFTDISDSLTAVAKVMRCHRLYFPIFPPLCAEPSPPFFARELALSLSEDWPSSVSVPSSLLGAVELSPGTDSVAAWLLAPSSAPTVSVSAALLSSMGCSTILYPPFLKNCATSGGTTICTSSSSTAVSVCSPEGITNSISRGSLGWTSMVVDCSMSLPSSAFFFATLSRSSVEKSKDSSSSSVSSPDVGSISFSIPNDSFRSAFFAWALATCSGDNGAVSEEVSTSVSTGKTMVREKKKVGFD